jgi:hypothetical protein
MAKFTDRVDKWIFRDAGDGRTIIFPWGFLGRAYATASETLKMRMRILYAFSLATTVVAVILTNHMSILMMLPTLGIYTVVYFGALKLILANAPDLEPLPRSKSAALFAAEISTSFIAIGVFGCLMFVLFGALMIATGDGEARLTGYFAVAVFGFFCAGYGWLWFMKRRLEGVR